MAVAIVELRQADLRDTGVDVILAVQLPRQVQHLLLKRHELGEITRFGYLFNAAGQGLELGFGGLRTPLRGESGRRRTSGVRQCRQRQERAGNPEPSCTEGRERRVPNQCGGEALVPRAS